MNEYPAGENQTIVVYQSVDTGNEIDTAAVFADIAHDAAARAAQGLRIVSMTLMPLRHSAAFLGREGSGFQTKAAVAVVYAAS